VCQKRQWRCPALLAIREEALQEWARAETYSDVCRAWGRLDGRDTFHRYGPGHFARLTYSQASLGKEGAECQSTASVSVSTTSKRSDAAWSWSTKAS
jgi:hypothetical protein